MNEAIKILNENDIFKIIIDVTICFRILIHISAEGGTLENIGQILKNDLSFCIIFFIFHINQSNSYEIYQN